jgi:ABC-type microcin C transport system permease subunit YejE
VTLRRIRRFREIKRGYYSLIILIALGGFAALDQVVVGKRALAVQYKGKWVFRPSAQGPEEQGFRHHRRIRRGAGQLPQSSSWPPREPAPAG